MKHSSEDTYVAECPLATRGRRNPATRDICLAGVVLGLFALALFLPCVTHDFVNYDDPAYITENPHLRDGLTAEAAVWALTGVRGGLWAPLTWLSHALDITLFGMNPAGHHFVNVLFHAGNVVLLFLVLTRWTARLWPAALAAALFACHPLHVEPVAWAASRKDMLSTLCLLLALLAYDGYARNRRVRDYLPVAGAFALGLLSKPMVVTLPCLLLLLDYWPYRRFSGGGGKRAAARRALRLAAEKAPLFVLAAGAGAATLWAQRNAITPVDDFTVGLRAAHGFTAYWVYLAKTVWPHPLAVPYYLDLTAIRYWKGAAGLAGLAGVTIVLLRLQRGGAGSGWRGALLTGWLWFLIALLPVAGFLSVGHHAWADRFTYLPHIGLFAAAGVGLSTLVRRRPGLRIPVTACAVAVLLVFSGLTLRQMRYWRNPEALFGHAVAVTRHNYIAHANLAKYLMEQGRPADAVEHYRRAAELQPRDLDALNNLGVACLLAGRNEEAVEALSTVVAAWPEDPEARVNLGAALYQTGRFGPARAQAIAALRLAPEFGKARQLLGLIARAHTAETGGSGE